MAQLPQDSSQRNQPVVLHDQDRNGRRAPGKVGFLAALGAIVSVILMALEGYTGYVMHRWGDGAGMFIVGPVLFGGFMAWIYGVALASVALFTGQKPRGWAISALAMSLVYLAFVIYAVYKSLTVP